MENVSDKIGLLIPGVRGLTSPKNPWVRLVKKESFLFYLARSSLIIENTHLTKGTQVLNRQIEGLPDMPYTRYPTPESKTGCNHTYGWKTNRIRSLHSSTSYEVSLLRRILGFVW